MRTRRKLATGIYADNYGIAVCAKRGGMQKEKRFPQKTPMRVLKEARNAMREAMGAAPLPPPPHGLNRHPHRFGFKECFVYFIQDGSSGAIKIGRASDVPKRISAIQTSNPNPLALLVSVRTTDYVERQLHRRFSHLRIDREWFRADADLSSAIERLKRGDPVQSILGDGL